MKSELYANDYLAAAAAERAHIAAVLAPVARAVSQRRAVRKNLIARLFGL